MLKEQIKSILTYIIILLILIIVISCEPVSVSVNSKGDVAFTRTEGVFFINLAGKKLTTLDWTYGQNIIPVLVRWSPTEDMLAYTVKKDANSTEAEVYVINLKGEKKKIYSSNNVITQLEWSPNAAYISLAKGGDDTNMSVADIVLIKMSDGMSKVLMQNTGDVHRWFDVNTILYMKISEKNQNNADILKGDLSLVKAETGANEILIKAMVSKTGGLDCSAVNKGIVFTAIKAGSDIGEFEKDMKSETFGFLYNTSDKKIEKISEDIINFVKYSPDGTKILIKSKKKDDYSSNFNLGFIDAKSKALKLLINNVCDNVYSNSTSVQVYPSWFNNNFVLYFRLINTYGSSGQALQLMSVDINSLKKQNYQVLIDSEIFKAVESKGGF